MGGRTCTKPHEIRSSNLAGDPVNYITQEQTLTRGDIPRPDHIAFQQGDQRRGDVSNMHEVALNHGSSAQRLPAVQQRSHHVRNEARGRLMWTIQKKDPSPGEADPVGRRLQQPAQTVLGDAV